MQHFGLISFVILTVGLALTAIRLPGGLRKTFSQRIAGNRTTEILYSALFILSLPLLYIFLANWLVPTKEISDYFIAFAAISALSQIACTAIPEREGWMTIAHRLLAGLSAIALLPMVLILASTESIEIELRYASGAAAFIMMALLVLAISSRKMLRYSLLLQITYYFAFFAIILMVTYL